MVAQPELKSIELKGFKSVDARRQTIELGPITVMLGANGAGKSNLVSFFRMLKYMTTGDMQQYVADQGFADSLLYLGAKITSEVSASLRFENECARDEYAFVLRRDATGRLFIQDETVVHQTRRRCAGISVERLSSCNTGDPGNPVPEPN